LLQFEGNNFVLIIDQDHVGKNGNFGDIMAMIKID